MPEIRRVGLDTQAGLWHYYYSYEGTLEVRTRASRSARPLVALSEGVPPVLEN